MFKVLTFLLSFYLLQLSSGDEYALKMITRVGCAVSIVALTLTLITLSVYR